ncbi:MAG: peptidylprolyl isomerase [Gammaproteobacteria bacterium]|nr:peptidylprolyl isomerase [Gammaproteobacteria bacterium]
MQRFLISMMIMLGLISTSFAADEMTGITADIAKPYATLITNQGDITLELLPEKAPITVANFLNYANQGYYNGVIFHRVIKDFMIQTGGFTEQMVQKATQEPIKNEADNGLFNNRSSVAMARTAVVDSATSQFFINVKNNYFLNNGYRDFGYAVFANVVSGMEVVDAISQVATTRKQGMGDVPVEPIIIKEVKISYNKP